MRIVICGAPRSGKTTLAGLQALHTDDLIPLGWSEASEKVADDWMQRPGPWVIEGVAAARALRKYLAQHPNKPCDKVIYMPTPRTTPTPGQASMAKGVETVWQQIKGELQARGVEIQCL
jgi:adenylate kinase family enzyme